MLDLEGLDIFEKSECLENVRFSEIVGYPRLDWV